MAALGYKNEAVDPTKQPKPQVRKNTRGDFVVPNSLVENLALLTHAETAFMLIVLRRGGKTDGCVISDRNWQSWTGLKARAKEYAIKGLKEKGLRVLGRGDKAVYSVALSQWANFVLKATPPEIEKPRTAGRAVTAPLNMKVHTDCAANGCEKLCQSCEAEQPTHDSGSSNLIPFAQPVARPKSLAAIRSHGFATAGQQFIELLAKAVLHGAGFLPGDDDLVQLIHRATKKSQRSEGLYLSTLPPVVATWLDGQESAGSPVCATGCANFDELIIDLKALAASDPRFTDAVDRAIKKLTVQDWSGLDVKELFAIVDKIKAEIEHIAIELYLITPEAATQDARIRDAAKHLGLSDRQMDSHVLMHIEFYAFEALNIPFQWVRWLNLGAWVS